MTGSLTALTTVLKVSITHTIDVRALGGITVPFNASLTAKCYTIPLGRG